MKKNFIITDEAVAKFNAYAAENKESGKTLTQLFEEYAKAQGADISAAMGVQSKLMTGASAAM